MRGKNHNGFSKGTDIEKKLHNVYIHMTHKSHYKYETYRCKEWEEYPLKFYEWAFNNGYLEHIERYGHKNTTLDRKDNNNPYYSPENCRWTTLLEQSRNKTTTIWVEYKSEKMSLKEWCLKLNLKYQKIWHRIKVLNWTPLQALELETRKRRRKNALPI